MPLQKNWDDVKFDVTIKDRVITDFTIYPPEKETPEAKNYDGLNIQCNALIQNCTIDMTNQPKTDEAFSVVRDGNALVENTVIRGTGKLALIGTGEKDGIGIIEFRNCTFENGCRRFPEVQDGYIVICNNCTIKNWGLKKFFDKRAFGSWAHTKDSKLVMNNCHFEQNSFFQIGFFNFFIDIAYQISQAVIDEGIKGLFHVSTWIPGVCRGAFATDGGKIELNNCTKNHWWIYLQGNKKI